jgi:hypothetical protein
MKYRIFCFGGAGGIIDLSTINKTARELFLGHWDKIEKFNNLW